MSQECPKLHALKLSGAHQITSLTKFIKFKANAISSAMDVANGGVKAHGGFHRVFGGHSIADIKMWQKHGIKFPAEVFKDSLTPNGVPGPGVETLVKAKKVSASTATKWGSLHVGKACAGVIAAVDTYGNIKRFVNDGTIEDDKLIKQTFKGAIEIGFGFCTGNIPVAVCGVVDLGLTTYTAIEKSVVIAFQPYSVQEWV